MRARAGTGMQSRDPPFYVCLGVCSTSNVVGACFRLFFFVESCLHGGAGLLANGQTVKNCEIQEHRCFAFYIYAESFRVDNPTKNTGRKRCTFSDNPGTPPYKRGGTVTGKTQTFSWTVSVKDGQRLCRTATRGKCSVKSPFLQLLPGYNPVSQVNVRLRQVLSQKSLPSVAPWLQQPCMH